MNLDSQAPRGPNVGRKRLMQLAAKYGLPITDPRVTDVKGKPFWKVQSMADDLLAESLRQSRFPLEAERLRRYASFYYELIGKEPLPGMLGQVDVERVIRSEVARAKKAGARGKPVAGLEVGKTYVVDEPVGTLKPEQRVTVLRVKPNEVRVIDAAGKKVIVSEPASKVATRFGEPEGGEPPTTPTPPVRPKRGGAKAGRRRRIACRRRGSERIGSWRGAQSRLRSGRASPLKRTDGRGPHQDRGGDGGLGEGPRVFVVRHEIW